MFRSVRPSFAIVTVLMAAAGLRAATLQQLSFEQMSQSATAVVRARVVDSSAGLVGSSVYTHYKLNVSEVWKGESPSEVALPGGTVNGRSESYPGVPELRVGAEYVLFLWTSRTTGITHLVGLSQGLFELTSQDGAAVASRRASGEAMLDAAGRRTSDQAMSMPLAGMKARVRQAVSR